MKKAIYLTDEHITIIKQGKFIPIEFSDDLTLRIEEYSIEEQMVDEFGGKEMNFIQDNPIRAPKPKIGWWRKHIVSRINCLWPIKAIRKFLYKKKE